MPHPPARDILALLAMAVLFGLTFIASKAALAGLDIFQLVFARYILAFLVLAWVFRRRLPDLRIARRDWGHFLILTAVEPIGYFTFETWAVYYTTPASVSLLIATVPAFALLFGWGILAERPGWREVLGILICFLGVYLIVGRQEASGLAPDPLLGNVLALATAMSAGLYNVLARRLSFSYSPLVITFYQALAATVVFAPLATWEYAADPGALDLTLPVVGSVLYLSFGASLAGYYLLNRSLSRFGAAQVAVWGNLIPVVTIAASFMVYGEVLGWGRMAGAVLVVAGISVTFVRARARAAAAPVP